MIWSFAAAWPGPLATIVGKISCQVYEYLEWTYQSPDLYPTEVLGNELGEQFTPDNLSICLSRSSSVGIMSQNSTAKGDSCLRLLLPKEVQPHIKSNCSLTFSTSGVWD